MKAARIIVFAGLSFAFGCGAQLSDGAEANAVDGGLGVPECFSSSECPVGWTCTDLGTCQAPPGDTNPDTDAGLPPEVEREFTQPQSALRYLYVAMTDLDAVARIDGKTLEVTSIEVGEAPRVVATAPGTDTAVVLDSENGAATILRPTANSNLKVTLATLPHLNRIAIDPTGTYAIAWFDLAQAIADAGSLEQVGQLGSFQDVTLLDLSDAGNERAVDLTVGFRPRKVALTGDGHYAMVITEDGISVIDVAAAFSAGPHTSAPIPLSDDPFADPASFEVDVVRSGEIAVVRQSDQASVRIIDLLGDNAGQARDVALPGVPTDLDLAPDETRAYAVLRDTSQLAVIDLGSAALPPVLIDLGGQKIGSLVLSNSGDRGLLYTNAELIERITVIDLTGPGYAHVTYPLKKAVRHAVFAPSGEAALIIHAKAPGDPDAATDFEQLIDRSYGYSILDVNNGFPKLQITEVDPGAFAFAKTTSRAYLALGDDQTATAQRRLHIIEMDTGVVREVELSSPPETVGLLPSAGQAFVSQAHPLGRVSFIDVATGAVRTITGFDLNSQIVD